MNHTFSISMIALFFCITVLKAEHKVSVGIEGGVANSTTRNNSSNYEEYTEKYFERSFQITPFVGIMAGEKVELIPGVSLSYNKSGDEDKIEDSLVNYYSNKSLSFGVNFGTYFHLIRKNIFHLSMGPKIKWGFTGKPDREYDSSGVIITTDGNDYYDKYSNNQLGLSVPMNCDFYLGKVFGIRLSFTLISMGININSYKLEGSDSETTNSDTYLTILGSDLIIYGYSYPITGIIPTASIFFRF